MSVVNKSEEKLKEDNLFIPSQEFQTFFRENIINKVNFYDPSHIKPYYISTYVLEYGMANFDKPYSSGKIQFSVEEKVLLYCYYNLRQHIFTQIHILKEIQKYSDRFYENVSFLDVGCGPMAGALALFEYLILISNKGKINYIGIDVADSMLQKSEELNKVLTEQFTSKSKIAFETGSAFQFCKPTSENLAKLEYESKNIVVNFSFLFANISEKVIYAWADIINNLREKYKDSEMFIIYQNTKYDNTSLEFFKNHLKNFNVLTSGGGPISFQYWSDSPVKQAEFVYEVLVSTKVEDINPE